MWHTLEPWQSHYVSMIWVFVGCQSAACTHGLHILCIHERPHPTTVLPECRLQMPLHPAALMTLRMSHLLGWAAALESLLLCKQVGQLLQGDAGPCFLPECALQRTTVNHEAGSLVCQQVRLFKDLVASCRVATEQPHCSTSCQAC